MKTDQERINELLPCSKWLRDNKITTDTGLYEFTFLEMHVFGLGHVKVRYLGFGRTEVTKETYTIKMNDGKFVISLIARNLSIPLEIRDLPLADFVLRVREY
jgi:hypothetical protein